LTRIATRRRRMTVKKRPILMRRRTRQMGRNKLYYSIKYLTKTSLKPRKVWRNIVRIKSAANSL
jgi:hypothetical protein